MQEWQRERNFLKTIDHLANDIGALVSEKQVGQHLHLEIRSQFGVFQATLHIAQHVSSITLQVLKRAVQFEVLNHLDDDHVQVLTGWVPGLVGRLGVGFVVLDVLGADRGSDKNKFVLKITAV